MRTDEDRYRALAGERGRLIYAKWFQGGLTSRQRRRLWVLGRCLDKIEMRQMQPNFKRLERQVRQSERDRRISA